ncbi:MAG: hypothetical protein Q9M26_00700 [Mariprofundales bacterium]|nr:hypothetical protein [Mariprofundales bacterium]
MIARVLVLLFGVLLVACAAHQPPLQMMAEARSAIQAAHDRVPAQGSAAARKLADANISLRKASMALDHQSYDRARAEAQQARNLARAAIRMMRKATTTHH